MPTAMAVDELPISFDEQALLRLCGTYRIAELSFFGSVLRDDFNVRSDVDVLVEFLPDTPVRTLFLDQYSWYALRRDLAALFHRKVDVVDIRGLDRYIKDDVMRRRVIVYRSTGNGGALVMPKRKPPGDGSGGPEGVSADLGAETGSPKGGGTAAAKNPPGRRPERAKGVHAFVEIDRAEAMKARGIKKPDLYLWHMRDDCQLLLKSTAGLTYEDFVAADMVWRAGIGKLVEQIGENAGRLGRSFRQNHPEIRWDSFIESRHHLAHGYEHVMMDTVWHTVTEEVPALLAGLEPLIRELTDPAPQGEQG